MAFEGALRAYFMEIDDLEKNERIRPFLERISKHIKSTSNEKYDEWAKDITSNFSDKLIPRVIGMFFAESDNIRRDIMKARINFLNISSQRRHHSDMDK
jgi:hypothetical protein